MRRAFIDLIGRIPTPEEIIDFETSPAPTSGHGWSTGS